MCKKLSDFWKYIDNATTPATSRIGIVFGFLALCGIFFAVEVIETMSVWIWLGLGCAALAIILVVFWLIKGSKDPTATKDDITKLGDKIEKAIKDNAPVPTLMTAITATALVLLDLLNKQGCFRDNWGTSIRPMV